MQAQAVYQPQRDITGPAFSAWFKMLATMLSLALIGYVISFLLRYPSLSDGAQLFLLAAIAVVVLYWRDFLRATLTINSYGIRQTGWLVQQVGWDDVRGARLIGLSRLGWLMRHDWPFVRVLVSIHSTVARSSCSASYSAFH